MKLFLGSIVVIAVTCFAPLAFGQQFGAWTNQGSNSWDTAGNWTTGIAVGFNPGPNDSIVIFPGFVATPSGTGTIFVNPGGATAITINTSNNQTIGSLAISGNFQDLFNDDPLESTTNPILDLNFTGGAGLTVSGTTEITGNSNVSITGNYTQGNGPLRVGLVTSQMILDSGDVTQITGSGTLNFINATADFSTASVVVGNGASGLMTQSNSTVTVSNLSIGTSGGTGMYTVSNGSELQTIDSSTITLGDSMTTGALVISDTSEIDINGNSQLNITNGSLTQGSVDQGSGPTVNLNEDTEVNIGEGSGTTGVYNLDSGNLNANDTSILVVGDLSGANGILNQTGGTLTVASGAIFVVGGFGTGQYNLSGGSANIQGDLDVGFGAGAVGAIVQSGNSTLTTAQNVNIGLDGAGSYTLLSGTADFQRGFTIGAQGMLSQSGGTLISEDASTVTGTYTMSAGNSTFNNSLALNGELDLNGGTFTVASDQFTGSGILNWGGGTLKLTGSSPFIDSFSGSLIRGISTIDTSSSTIASVDFTHSLAGQGGISFVGNGTTAFNYTMANSYTGQTSIQAGTLNAIQAGIVSSSGLNIGNTGIANLNLSSGGFNYNGALSGSGLLNVNYATAGDTLALLNASNNFTGNIVLGANGTSGVLQVYSGTFSNISDNGTGSDVTVGGGSGPASGTVVFSGPNNTYTGSTTINPNFTVQAANFAGDVINHGTLSTLGTQNSPGSLNIAGNLVSTGVITVFVNGATSDSYTAAGATLSGLINVKGSGTNQYAIVTTTQGITITGTLNDPNGLTTNAATALFSSSLSLDPTNDILLLNTTQNSLSGFAITPNQRAVASVLDPLTQSPPPAFTPLLTTLNGLSAAQIPVALEELTPESLQYSRMIAFENATFMVQKVNGMLGDMRSGYTGLDANGISYSMPGFNSGLAHSLSGMLASNAPSFHTTAPNGVNYYPDGSGSNPVPSDYDEPATPRSRMTPADAASPTSYDGQVLSDSPIPMRTSEPPTLRTSRFTEFVAGDVVLADLNQNANMPSKASYTSGDVSAGVGFRMTSNLTVGVLFDYNHTNAKTDSNGSNTTVNSYSPGVFATYYNHNFYVNGLFSFGFNQYDNSRNVPVAGGTADSNPNGQQYVANLDFGYDFHPSKQWVAGPTLGVTYTHLNIDSFSESGAPEADLNVNSQSVDSVRSRLGGHVEYLAEVGNIILQPHFSAMWQHEYLDNGPGITSNFESYGTGPFTIQTASPSKDSALLGIGLTATLNNSLCFYLDYMADVGGGDYLAQSIIGGVKASF